MEKVFEIHKATEQEIIERIENNELTESDAWWLIHEMEHEREYGDDSRWSKSAYSIIKLEDRYFGIDWEKGLTEMQEDYLHGTTFEEIKKIKEVVTVERWVLV